MAGIHGRQGGQSIRDYPNSPLLCITLPYEWEGLDEKVHQSLATHLPFSVVSAQFHTQRGPLRLPAIATTEGSVEGYQHVGERRSDGDTRRK